MLEIPVFYCLKTGDKNVATFSCTKEYFDEVIKPNDGKEIAINGIIVKQVSSERSGRHGICYNPNPFKLASIVIEEINHNLQGE